MAETSPSPPAALPAWLGRALRWIGHAALVAALTFIGLAFVGIDWAMIAERFSVWGWTVTALVALIHAALLALLACAWAGDASRGQPPPGCAQATEIYGPGVIAKYIPGSVFQYASRQVLGAQRGWSQRTMAHASLTEAALHVPCALMVAAALARWPSPVALLPLALAAAALFVLKGSARPLARAAILQLCYFSGFGLIAAALASCSLGIDEAGTMAALFMLAWVAGFLMPLAPGGVGVRESALLLLAAPHADTETILAFALVTRLVTTGGDAIFGLGAYLLTLRRCDLGRPLV